MYLTCANYLFFQIDIPISSVFFYSDDGSKELDPKRLQDCVKL